MRGIGECDQRGVDGVVVGVGWSGGMGKEARLSSVSRKCVRRWRRMRNGSGVIGVVVR